MAKKVTEPPYREGEHTQMLLMAQEIKYISKEISEVKRIVENQAVNAKKEYVSQVEFDPIKRLVYGLVAIILVAVVTAIMALVIQK